MTRNEKYDIIARTLYSLNQWLEVCKTKMGDEQFYDKMMHRVDHFAADMEKERNAKS